MSVLPRRLFAGSLLVALIAAPALAAEPAPLLLRSPTLSATEIVISYAGDLWSVPRSGGDAHRLTTSPGLETNPLFSPDGHLVAFTGEYDGNADVYVVPAGGGEPRRLTWHPARDQMTAWSPDGKALYFVSQRASGTDDVHLFRVPVEGGWPERLPLPSVWQASLSPDGRRVAYVPHLLWQPAWKHYRGGQTTPIWLVDWKDLSLERIPRENSNDRNPIWVGDRVYFLSDRGGRMALYRYAPDRHAVELAYGDDAYDIKSASAGPGAIVFERFGAIGLYDLATGGVSWPDIRVAGDLPGVRPRFVDVSDDIRSVALSPTGKRALFGARGDIFTVPAEKGDVRNLTRSSDAANRDPVWSPDGKTIAYLSDASGEYALHLVAQDGSGSVRRIALGVPPSFFYSPVFSPDGARIALTDKRLDVWIVELANGTMTRVATDTYETPEHSLDPAWSPDGKFLAFTKRLPSFLHAVFVYSLADGKVRQATDGFSDARFPVFDASGKYLYFTASTDWGPTAPWIDLSSLNHPVSRQIYLAVLDRKLPSPLAPESDEEGKADSGEGKGADPDDADAAPATPPKVVFDFDRLAERIVALPAPPENILGLAPGKPGELFLQVGPRVAPLDEDEEPPVEVKKFKLESRDVEKLSEGVTDFALSRDGEKMLLHQGDDWILAGTGEPVEAGKGKLDLSGLEARVDPPAEWRQMFREVWRIERDFLYDPGAHGLDLEDAERRYARFLPGIAHRADLNYLFAEMTGEIGVGHTFVSGGDLPKPPEVAAGLLGADFEIVDGRYRFARVFDGESWNPDLEAPLTQPGVDVVAGDFLLAVEGREVVPPANVYSFFEQTAGKAVRLRIAKDAKGKEAREVTVVPIEDETGLRYRAWVEENRRTVDRLSGGRLAYLHLPDTGAGGYTEFNRYFFPQVDKQGIVVDERYNHGGSLADYVVDFLNRPIRSLLMTREGEDQSSPAGAIAGPKVMLINEMSGSGGDALPWYFRKAGLGPLVGTRTWGGLVGIYDYPELLDGGSVTAPRVALYGLEGRWEVENVGIAPDVAVEMTPAECRDGGDPQLERAVAWALEELEKHPVPHYARPPFPDYQVSPWKSEAKP